MIIVGSTAAAYRGISRKGVSDLDIWVSEKEDNLQMGDIHILPEEVLSSIPCEGVYPTANALYTIKCSHLAWDIHWEKTKSDILYMKGKGCVLIPELYHTLKRHWAIEKGNKDFLSLNKKKEDFFDDHVTYVHDHDYLHTLVARAGVPMYLSCLKEGHKVLTDHEKFCSMSHADQVRMFREEITVIACERWLTNPFWYGKVSWYKAYQLSLKKVITSLTKNWACDFLIHHLEEFVAPDYSYFENLLNKLNLEKIMSNVDIKVFEDFMEAESDYTDLKELVYNMCEGSVYFNGGVEYPSRDAEDRDAELAVYHKAQADAEQAGLLRTGYEHLSQEGGGEGGSEYCEGVFKLSGKIYKAEYSYYSHDGHDTDYILDTLREVTPVVKTITVYE
tara:strand:- start:22 stop:1191 length:1170 start_codon:yes stop_codon:yes gene_type:complete